jgi:uncharacterized membrane protein YqiK
MSANILGTVLLWLIGLAVAIVILVYILRWLYRRSTKETAFVRTGASTQAVAAAARSCIRSTGRQRS